MHLLDENLKLVFFLAKAQKGKGHFRRWTVDELVSETYLIAKPAIDKRFDPSKGSLSRFLTRIIIQDVNYKYRRLHGAVRRRIDGKNVWIQLERPNDQQDF